MDSELLRKADGLIDQYRKEHRGESPLYIALSPDDASQLRELIRQKDNVPEGHVVTKYRNVTLSEQVQLLPGNIYVSSELPETGS